MPRLWNHESPPPEPENLDKLRELALICSLVAAGIAISVGVVLAGWELGGVFPWGCAMAKLSDGQKDASTIAAELAVSERVLLFCLASGWMGAGWRHRRNGDRNARPRLA
jgi:hypothetical protein